MTAISVVITSDGQTSSGLANCLKSLDQTGLKTDDWEIIIVDSGSGRETKDFLLKEAEIRQNLICVFPERGNIGPAKARNIGIKRAGGEIAAFTDDDITVDENWLETILAGFKKYPEVAGVGGLTLPPSELRTTNVFAQYENFVYHQYLKRGEKFEYFSTKRDEHPVFTGNIAYRKSILEKAGCFREDFSPFIYGEDGDLKERVLALGGKFLFIPSINIHNTEYTFPRFLEREKRRGASILKFNSDHRQCRQSLWSIYFRLFLTPLLLLKNILKYPAAFKLALVITLAYSARQMGKIKYYGNI